MSTEEPATTVQWPEGQPLYSTSYYPDDREILATVRDLHGIHLFTVVRRRRDAAYEASINHHGVDQLISDEVIRRLEREDWENNAVYRLD
jgi:hypothetical protein